MTPTAGEGNERRISQSRRKADEEKQGQLLWNVAYKNE